MGTAAVWLRLGDPLSAGAQVLGNSWGPGTGPRGLPCHRPPRWAVARLLGAGQAGGAGRGVGAGAERPDWACSRLTSRF